VPQLSLGVPEKRVSAWVAETDPKYARAWLEALPFADSMAAAVELYQSLYTLNRLDLDAARRMELLALYEEPVASVATSLVAPLQQLSFPLGERRTQLSRLSRQLAWEMANGYKCALQDLSRARLVLGRKQQYPPLVHRAMHYLSWILLRCYQVYAPYPAKVWADLHELYRFSEEGGWQSAPIASAVGYPGPTDSIAAIYRRVLLLFLARPYQLLQNECLLVQRLLTERAEGSRLGRELGAAETPGCFVVDLAADAPPRLPRREDLPGADERGLRLLDASELVGELRGLVARLNKGASVSSLGLELDCLETACHDLFKRLVRAWGNTPRRRHSRLKRRGYVSVCAGVGALHFFASGQKPFQPPAAPPAERTDQASPDRSSERSAHERVEGQQAPGETQAAADQTVAPASSKRDAANEVAPPLYRVDRWQVNDVSPHGLLLRRLADSALHMRVGEVLGIQRIDQLGQWTVAVVRWLRNLDDQRLEMGVELLAPAAKPVAARTHAAGAAYSPGLLLPAMEQARRPATLLLERGALQPQTDMEVAEEGGSARRARPLQLLERTGAFEQVVFGYLMD
jgi:hypothetical protein